MSQTCSPNIKPITKSIDQIPENSFHIRRRKTFLVDKKQRIYKKDTNKRISYVSLGTIQGQRNSFQRRKSSLMSIKDFRDIEDEIKFTILEMRRSCLWEIRRQSMDLFNAFEKKDSKNEKEQEQEKYVPMLKFVDDDEEGLSKSFKRCKTSAVLRKKKTIRHNMNKNEEKKNNEKKEENKESNENKNNEEKKKYKSSKDVLKVVDNKISILPSDKFRFIARGGLIIDSHNENESDEEPEPDGIFINPETKFIFIFDAFIALGAYYSLIYIPYELAKYFCFCTSSNNFINYFIYFFLDALFLLDIIVWFCRGYYTKEEEKLIKNRKLIFNNYICGWFLTDFIAGLPFNALYLYYCKKSPNKICYTYDKDNLFNFLILIRCLKAIKIFKVSSRKRNQFVTYLMEYFSELSLLDNSIDLIIKISSVILGLHIMSCAHIFIGKHTFPGWIYKNNFQDYSLLNLYMISLYYLITTMTTVGYGEIQMDSMVEVVFRIILLAVGIICYSWIISSISNGINKQSYASINFSNECALLESIRRGHRELPFKVYFAIKKYLEDKHFRQKSFDKNLLINSLPYSLKNSLIFSMYRKQIDNFHFFKGISNSNFLVETLSYLTPITGKKNDILIKENEIIEDIYFVNEGRLALEVPIDMDNQEESTNKYISDEFLNFAFDFDYEANYNQIPQISNINGSNLGETMVHSIIGTRRNSFCNSMILKIREEKKKSENNVYLKIHDIHKNEDFGDIYMFFGKRSPFALRVKTKRVKLYAIKKTNFTELCQQYQNVLKRIHKKKKHNYKIIKNILIKTVSKFCDTKGIKIKEQYRQNVDKAMKEFNKKLIPFDLMKSEEDNRGLDEIDEQINNTIKEFESEISCMASGINSKNRKKKMFGNLLKIHTTTEENDKKGKNNINLYNTHIKGTTIEQDSKHSFLEEIQSPPHVNEKLHYTESINGSKRLFFNNKFKDKKRFNPKKKKKKKKKVKTVIKSNLGSNIHLRGYDFDYSESDESVKTVKISGKGDESLESGPKTINILPQSLINLLKTKIKYQNLLNEKGSSSFVNDQIIIINKNDNLIDEHNYMSNNINSNIHNKFNINNTENTSKNYNSNIRSNKLSSSTFTFSKIANNQTIKEEQEQEISNFSNKFDKISPTNRVLKSKMSIRDTISPFTSKMFSKISKGKNKQKKNSIFYNNQYNNFQKCSITNNNILLKLNDDLLKKNYIFDSENLSSTSADSFEIKSSYSNINEASEGAYIKEKNFQKDLLKYVKDYKTRKKTMMKRKNTRLSVDNMKSQMNYLSVENIKNKMSYYLSKQIRIIRNSNFGLNRKNSYTQKIKSKKTKKELSINSAINSSSIFNSSQISLNNNNNNNIRTSHNSFNEIESPKLKINKHNSKIDDDTPKGMRKIKDTFEFEDKKPYKYSSHFKTEKNHAIYV